MGTIHLASVPQPRTSPAMAHLAEQFRRRVVTAIEELDGHAAAEEILRLYRADTEAMEARMHGAEEESTTAASESRTRYDMLQQVHASASHMLLHQAKLTAEVSHCRSALEYVKQLAARSEDGTVDVETLLAALAHEPLSPVYVPTPTAFTADDRYRSGYFESVDQAVHVTFPFIGYALVDHGPGAAGIIEPVFLVDSRALPLSILEAEKPVRLQQMLPAAPLAAAS